MPFYGKNDQDIATRILKKTIDLESEAWSHISERAKEVVKGLLTRRPANRISLATLLEHAWITEEVESADPKTMSE